MGIVGSYHADERDKIVKTQQSSDQLHNTTCSLNFGPTTACQQISSKLSGQRTLLSQRRIVLSRLSANWEA
jgi:hypothetical protein